MKFKIGDEVIYVGSCYTFTGKKCIISHLSSYPHYRYAIKLVGELTSYIVSENEIKLCDTIKEFIKRIKQ